MKKIKEINDKFYTKSDVAFQLLQKININDFDFVIEPSVGSGSFFNLIHHPNKLGIDILPDLNEIKDVNKVKHADFLKSNFKKDSKILVVGNPPFGRQGSLAMKFIKKSAEFADTIAFILPASFSKQSF